MAGNTEGREVLPDKLEDARQAGGKNSNRCTLILTEGDSSKALAVWSLSLVFVEVVERVIGLSWSKH